MLVRPRAATAATAAAAARLAVVGHTHGAGGPELSRIGARSDGKCGGGRGGGAFAVTRGAVQGVVEAADPLVVDCARHGSRV